MRTFTEIMKMMEGFVAKSVDHTIELRQPLTVVNRPAWERSETDEAAGNGNSGGGAAASKYSLAEPRWKRVTPDVNTSVLTIQRRLRERATFENEANLRLIRQMDPPIAGASEQYDAGVSDVSLWFQTKGLRRRRRRHQKDLSDVQLRLSSPVSGRDSAGAANSGTAQSTGTAPRENLAAPISAPPAPIGDAVAAARAEAAAANASLYQSFGQTVTVPLREDTNLHQDEDAYSAHGALLVAAALNMDGTAEGIAAFATVMSEPMQRAPASQDEPTRPSETAPEDLV